MNEELKDINLSVVLPAYNDEQNIKGLVRFLISRIYNMLFRLPFGVKVRDVNCSFKLIRKDVLFILCFAPQFINYWGIINLW